MIVVRLVVTALLVAVDVLSLHLVVDVAITLRARMIVATVITIGATGTALGAQMTVTVR